MTARVFSLWRLGSTNHPSFVNNSNSNILVLISTLSFRVVVLTLRRPRWWRTRSARSRALKSTHLPELLLDQQESHLHFRLRLIRRGGGGEGGTCSAAFLSPNGSPRDSFAPEPQDWVCTAAKSIRIKSISHLWNTPPAMTNYHSFRQHR